MSLGVISDNWSLQTISEMLVKGFEFDSYHCLEIDKTSESYGYEEIPNAVVSCEALFDFITDIILRDQILVDDSYVKTWKKYKSPLSLISDVGLICEYPFLVDYDKLLGPREEFIKKLCIVDELENAHKENVLGWNENRQTPHKYLSQILWGGAGMLARSFVYERGYTPHPIRKKLFIDAGLALPADNAVNHVLNIIEEKRASIASVQSSGAELFSLTVNMDPLPIRVIQESNSVEDLIPVALQLREDYRELREWLTCYQEAMSDGSYKDIAKFQKVIRSISMYVDSLMGSSDSNAPTFSTGIGVFKVTMKGQPLNTLNNQFGVRSMINNLIVGHSGSADLKKFLGFFGHRNSAEGLRVLEHFTKS